MAAPITDYVVLEATSWERLRHQVLLKISEGYEPQGGASLAQQRSERGNSPMCSQAMVKRQGGGA